MTSQEQSQAFYLAETVTLIGKNFLSDEQITRDLNSIIDSIMHTAPEIINKKWMDIYLYCSNHFTDIENIQHYNAFNIYQDRYQKYKSLFI